MMQGYHWGSLVGNATTTTTTTNYYCYYYYIFHLPLIHYTVRDQMCVEVVKVIQKREFSQPN
jgi:hypothetical protein